MERSAWAGVAICVPVRNERASLPGLLAAIARQQPCPAGPPTVCLLFDGCSDGSEALAAALAPALPFRLLTATRPTASEPNAGRARRAAMEIGLAALPAQADAALLTTDADTLPAPDWMAQSCAALLEAELVCGHVARDGDRPSLLQDRIDAHFDRLYDFRRDLDPVPWEPRPAHHYTAGASMGFRTGAYRALGGFAPRAAAEDAGIVDAAGRAGLRVRRDRGVRVTTSSRRVGQVRNGMADHLRSLDADASPDAVRVGHPNDAAWQHRGQAIARRAFEAGGRAPDLDRLAARIGLAARAVREVAEAAPNAEAFAMRVVPAAPGADRLVSLPDAERALAALIDCRHEPAR